MSQIRYKRILLKLSERPWPGASNRAWILDTIGRVCDVVGQCVAPGRPGGHCGRRRQLLAWPEGRFRPYERTRADHMGCWPPPSTLWLWRTAWSSREIPVRVQTAIEMKSIAEPTSGARPLPIWSRGVWSSLAAAPVTPISPPIRARCSGVWRSGRTPFCLPKMWTGSTGDLARTPSPARYDQLTYEMRSWPGISGHRHHSHDPGYGQPDAHHRL